MLVGKEAKTLYGLIKSKSRENLAVPGMDQVSASSPITPKHDDQSYYAET